MYVYGKTREDVHDKWIELHNRAKAGPVATTTGTLGSYIDYWLREIIEPNRAPATYDNYERFARLYIKPGLGDKRLARLQVRDVQVWINQVAKTCQCCAQGKDAKRAEGKRRCCARPEQTCCRDLPSSRMVSDIRNTLRSALSNAISRRAAGPQRRGSGQAPNGPEAQGQSVVQRGGPTVPGVGQGRRRSVLRGLRPGPRSRPSPR